MIESPALTPRVWKPDVDSTQLNPPSCVSIGATALIENDYPECGLELSSVILDVAQEADKEAGKGNGQPVPADLVHHALLHIDSTLASQGGKQGTNDGMRKKLLKAALKWSVGKGPRAFGDKEINATYGELLWATGELDKAVPRLVLAEAPGTLAERVRSSL